MEAKKWSRNIKFKQIIWISSCSNSEQSIRKYSISCKKWIGNAELGKLERMGKGISMRSLNLGIDCRKCRSLQLRLPSLFKETLLIRHGNRIYPSHCQHIKIGKKRQRSIKQSIKGSLIKLLQLIAIIAIKSYKIRSEN